MAGLNGEIIMKTAEYRPCYVICEVKYSRNKKTFERREKALFHRWAEISNVIPPSLLQGGHNGGEIKRVLAIVEFEDGKIETVDPSDIQFCDTAGIMNGIAWGEENGGIHKPQSGD